MVRVDPVLQVVQRRHPSAVPPGADGPGLWWHGLSRGVATAVVQHSQVPHRLHCVGVVGLVQVHGHLRWRLADVDSHRHHAIGLWWSRVPGLVADAKVQHPQVPQLGHGPLVRVLQTVRHRHPNALCAVFGRQQC